jgi:hypothetical protein
MSIPPARYEHLSLGRVEQHLQDALSLNTPAEADAMVFLVGGFDEGDAYGRVFEVSIPNSPAPVEKSVNDFGITFGGQL